MARVTDDAAGPLKERIEAIEKRMGEVTQAAIALPGRIQELEKERAEAAQEALKSLRVVMFKQGVDKLTKKFSDPVTAEDLKKHLPGVEASVLPHVLGLLGGEGQTREAVALRLSVKYKVVAAVGVSNGLAIKTSKTVRQLEEGTLLDALGFPEVDEAAGVTRVQVKDAKGSGWVSMKGNQGTVYLEEVDSSAAPMEVDA